MTEKREILMPELPSQDFQSDHKTTEDEKNRMELARICFENIRASGAAGALVIVDNPEGSINIVGAIKKKIEIDILVGMFKKMSLLDKTITLQILINECEEIERNLG